MAYQEPRRQTSDVLLYCEETQYRTSQEFSTRAFQPTVSTNTMTTTTITDTNVATGCVGCYVMPEDGSAKDQIRQIKSVSGTTATVDAAWTSTSGVTSVRVWTPADVPLRATTNGSTTTLVSSPHASITNEPDDYWNLKGYHVIWTTSTTPQASYVSDFATASGTFTVGTAFSHAPQSGQLAMLRKRLRPEGQPTIDVKRTAVARSIVGYGDAVQSVMVNHTGTAQFNLSVRGLATTAGDGTAAVAPVEPSDLLSAVMTQTLDTGDKTALTSPASGTTLTVQTGGSRWTVGGFVLLNTGEAAQIRSVSTTTLTVGSSHMTAASVMANTPCYAAAHYKRKSTDFRTSTLDYFMGGVVRKVMHGCLPTITATAARDQMVSLAFNYTAGEAHEYNLSTWVGPTATRPITILDTTVPYDGKGARCLVNGTSLLVNGLTVNFGFAPKMRSSLSGMNQSDGMMMALEPVTVEMTILADEDDRSSFEDIVDLGNRGVAMDFLYQKGTAPGNTFAMCAPALQLTEWPTSYEDGQGVYKLKGVAVLPQTVPSNSFDAGLPAFSIGWL